MSGEEVVVQAPALGLSLSSTAGGHNLVFQTHVDQNTTKEALDKLFDTWTAVAVRQQAKADLVELQKNRETQVAQLNNLREDRARIDANLAATAQPEGRRTKQINPTELRAREQSEVMEKKLVEILVRYDEQIKATRAIIGE